MQHEQPISHPDQESAGFFDRLTLFFEQNLTIIAIVIAFLGVIILAVGTSQGLFGQTDSSGTVTNNPLSVQMPGVSGGQLSADGALERELEPFTTIPERPRDHVMSYTVKPGDTLVGIANQFGLDRNTLFWSNRETLGDNVHFLQAHIDLNILPVDGVYHVSDGNTSIQTIAAKYNVEPEAILYSDYNELDGYEITDAPPWGMKLVIPGGTREIVDWQMPVDEVVDEKTGVVYSGFMPNMGGSCSQGISGGGGTGAWIPPMGSYTVTQGYYPGHSGIDLANVIGTPVLAADTGVVRFNGWVPTDWGYGILVVLDHGNGWTTYYAHLNGSAVGCGQTVGRGATVGYVGSTGKSSGPHLHFEMRWNHTPDNPAAYIGF